jgi:uncharacterized protein
MRIVFPKVLIELRPSRLDGVGVFAATPLKTDQRIAAGVADSDYRRLISWSSLGDYDVAVREKINAFCIGTPDGFIPPDKLDFNRLSVEWYLNHSCDGNVGFDEDGDFVARRPIRKSDELTYDYALAESNPRFRMECHCGSAHCRRVITGNDWKDADFREKNFDYMLPRLRRVSESARPESAKTIRMVARRR